MGENINRWHLHNMELEDTERENFDGSLVKHKSINIVNELRISTN